MKILKDIVLCDPVPAYFICLVFAARTCFKIQKPDQMIYLSDISFFCPCPVGA